MRDFLEVLAGVLIFLFVIGGAVVTLQRMDDARQDARQIAAEARQEARDIAYEQRQRQWGCASPESFESAVKRTD
jgi:type II secretory pathway pseudopilin PulG